MQDFISKKNRFPRKNDIKYITARKTVPPTVYGTRAVRFKTQRPQYKAFCYGRALFYLQNKPARSGNGLLNRLAADGG